MLECFFSCNFGVIWKLLSYLHSFTKTACLLHIESEAAIRAFCGQTLTIKSSERTAHITRKRHFKRSSAITLPVLREVNLSMYLQLFKQNGKVAYVSRKRRND